VVAFSGPGWILAGSLRRLIGQVDVEWPDRPRQSDGSIGDAAHAANPTSDHNPRQGLDGGWYVTALDITAAPWSDQLAAALIRDGRTKYVIWRGRYYQTIKWSDDPVGQWVDYSGPDPHTSHIHLSVNLSMVGNSAPWALHPGETPDMALIVPVLVSAPGKPMYIYWPLTGALAHVHDPVELEALQLVQAASGAPFAHRTLTAVQLVQLIEFTARIA
jgi:hypothetical protein